jgi:thymidylate kinase
MFAGKMKGKIIYICGPDGSGKTSIAKALVERLNASGGACYVHKWMRFNHYTSKLVNLIGRVAGLSYSELYPGGVKVGYHDYYRSKWISFLYRASVLFDTFWASLFRLWIPVNLFGARIVVDRFAYDTMVDLSIDLGDHGLCDSASGKFLGSLAHGVSAAIFLDVDIDVIYRRRPDTKCDRNYENRYSLYSRIADRYCLKRVSNNGDIGAALEAIEAIAGNR